MKRTIEELQAKHGMENVDIRIEVEANGLRHITLRKSGEEVSFSAYMSDLRNGGVDQIIHNLFNRLKAKLNMKALQGMDIDGDSIINVRALQGMDIDGDYIINTRALQGMDIDGDSVITMKGGNV